MMKWFLLQNERVNGPYSTEEIKAQVTDGQTDDSHLIWGHPQTGWENLSTWLKGAAQLTESHHQETSEQKWHYALNGESKGPFTRVELVNEVKSMLNKGEVLIWTKGMKAWADLYEFNDLLDEMGLNRREHPRAGISGSAIIRFQDQTLISQLQTISPGGFGAIGINASLAIGQAVIVDIKSSSLNEVMTLKANVQYITELGYFGFKFSGINMEARAIILEYIKSTKRQNIVTAA